MSVLTFQTTALVNLLDGRADDMSWTVRRIA